MLALPRANLAGHIRLIGAAGLLACALAGAAAPAAAQQRYRPGEFGGGSGAARPAAQATTNPDGLRLNAALSRLGRNPRDLDALIDAGNAALATGDVAAATGFFKRADQVSPRDSRVKAGLGRALVLSGDPLDALPLLDEAERAGAQPRALAGDRGLAYDLIGDNATAQKLYKLALSRGTDEDVTRRLALSQAIAGDKRGAEATLLPLLRQQDKASWRTRTFALAIMGQADESVRIAKTILPPELAESVAPYLRYMPQLTKAQQAAAANLGNFPRASEIGRDDPRFAQYVANAPRLPSLASADSALVPKGEPLGRGERVRSERQARKAEQDARQASSARVAAAGEPARVRPPEPMPTREAVSELPPLAAASPSLPSSSRSMSQPVMPSAAPTVPQVAEIAARPSAPPPAAIAAPVAAPVAGAAPASRAPALAPSRQAPVAQPGFDLATLPQGREAAPPSAPVSAPSPAPTPAPAAEVAAAPLPPPAALDRPAARLSLSDAFRDLGAPSIAPAPAAGAVDITRIKATKARPDPKLEAAKAPPKPLPPSHPSRIWVQIGIGRDKAALAADWKRMSRQADTALKGRKPYVSDMGQTNRMLVGPFESAAQANKFIADLKGAGLGRPYIWTSPAGQVVDVLTVR